MDKIPQIEVNGSKIERIPGPIVEKLAPPVVYGFPVPGLNIPRPVIEVPYPRIEYPQLPYVPSAPPAASGSPSQAASEGKKDPSREIPSSLPPPVYTQPKNVSQVPETPTTSSVKDTQYSFEVLGKGIQLPSPTEVAQASVTAVVGTSVTLATAMVFNQARRVVGEAVSEAAKKKFKIKLRAVKPVIHMIHEGEGITVMEYSAEGVRTLATNVTNPEQFLRDTIEADELYEADHKIVIDEPIRDMFSREGAKRFNYFAPAKKMARRLSARLTLG